MLEAKTLDRARAALRAKQAEIAKKLEELLAGQNVTLDNIPLPQEDDPSEPPVERLRRFLRILQGAADRLRSDEYGRCLRCGAEFTAAEVAETPWVERCRRCAAAPA